MIRKIPYQTNLWSKAPYLFFCEDFLHNRLEVGNGIMMNFHLPIWFEALGFTGEIFCIQNSEVGKNLH